MPFAGLVLRIRGACGRHPSNLGVLQGTADKPDAASASQATLEMPTRNDFVGGVQVDWLAATTSCALLLVMIGLSLNRILGLDEKLLMAIRRARETRLAKENQVIEATRQRLESQFRQDE